MTTNRQAEAVGGLLFIGFQGTEPEHVASVLETLRPAGLILLPRNIINRVQVERLVRGARRIADDLGMPRLLVATDQEGGTVLRLGREQGFTPLPSATVLGNLDDTSIASAAASTAGTELSAVGIDVNFAPVADLATDPANEVIGSRSYGSDPDAVAARVRSAVTAMQAWGVAAVAKHFPGHGATSVDSHLALPTLHVDGPTMLRRELVPFQAAIDADVAAVMTAHVITPLDRQVPATMSRRVLTELLRVQLGFKGVVISDSLEMRAIQAAGFDPGEAAVRSVLAGADLLIFDGNRQKIADARRGLIEAMESGRIAPDVILGAAARLQSLRQRLDRLTDSKGGIRPMTVDQLVQACTRGISVVGTRHVAHGGTLAVVPAAAGREFAASTGLPIVQPEGHESVIRVLVVTQWSELAGLATIDRDAVVVLAGRDVVGSIDAAGAPVVLAHDLPAALWPAIVNRLANEMRGTAA